METVESHDPGLGVPPLRLPKQLSLEWGETTGERKDCAPPGPEADGEASMGLTPRTSREQLIEAETRRVKMVCVSLFGLALLALRLFGN